MALDRLDKFALELADALQAVAEAKDTLKQAHARVREIRERLREAAHPAPENASSPGVPAKDVGELPPGVPPSKKAAREDRIRIALELFQKQPEVGVTPEALVPLFQKRNLLAGKAASDERRALAAVRSFLWELEKKQLMSREGRGLWRPTDLCLKRYSPQLTLQPGEGRDE